MITIYSSALALEKAISAHHSRTIRDITTKYGYKSSSAFTRAFRRTMGYTPKEYQEHFLLRNEPTIKKEKNMFVIKPVQNLKMLKSSYDLADYVLNLSSKGHMPYTFDFFAGEVKSKSDLLLYGEIDNRIIGVALGSNEGADDFYIKCGFTPTLFLQSQKHTLEELRSINTIYKEIWGLESDENGWCKLMLETPTVDTELRDKYDTGFEDCIPQTVFRMNL